MRSEAIEICTKAKLSTSSEPLCIGVEPSQYRYGSDIHLDSKKKVSELIDYMIIKDANGTELLNLRGEALDSAFRVVKETEYSITYRLDVN